LPQWDPFGPVKKNNLINLNKKKTPSIALGATRRCLFFLAFERIGAGEFGGRGHLDRGVRGPGRLLLGLGVGRVHDRVEMVDQRLSNRLEQSLDKGPVHFSAGFHGKRPQFADNLLFSAGPLLTGTRSRTCALYVSNHCVKFFVSNHAFSPL